VRAAATERVQHSIEARNAGVRYDLRLTHHRTLRQTLGGLGGRDPAFGDNPHFWALDDVSFTLSRGESLGIIGDNGSGKSTLLMLIAGILQPDRGEIRTHGSISPLLTLGVGFEPNLSGRENIYLNAAYLGVPRRRIEQRVDEIIAFADIGAFIDVPIRKYSTGMRTRLGFAIASHIEPDILLLDEVLGVGDNAFRWKSQRKMHELVERAGALVVVSHLMPFVVEMCTKVLWLEQGRVAGYGKPESVVGEYMKTAESTRAGRKDPAPEPAPAAARGWRFGA
jgi:lipopolysaccharide transport system ATP-binding protein